MLLPTTATNYAGVSANILEDFPAEIIFTIVRAVFQIFGSLCYSLVVLVVERIVAVDVRVAGALMALDAGPGGDHGEDNEKTSRDEQFSVHFNFFSQSGELRSSNLKFNRIKCNRNLSFHQHKTILEIRRWN